MNNPRGGYGGLFVVGPDNSGGGKGSPWFGLRGKGGSWPRSRRSESGSGPSHATSKPSNKALHQTKALPSVAAFAGERWCSTDRRGSTSTAYALLVILGISTSSNCSQGHPPPQQGGEPPKAPCQTLTVKSKESFKIHAFNEWSTVHPMVSGCSADAEALGLIVNGAALGTLREVANKQPERFPFCRPGQQYPELASELNRRFGRNVVLDACGDAVADI